jgi:hypothetical protein
MCPDLAIRQFRFRLPTEKRVQAVGNGSLAHLPDTTEACNVDHDPRGPWMFVVWVTLQKGCAASNIVRTDHNPGGKHNERTKFDDSRDYINGNYPVDSLI